MSILSLLSLSSFLSAQQLAFPSAEGYGRYVTGGRGGRIVEVANLNGDLSEGSFRAALATPGNDPITIVFRVSGTITLDTTVVKVGRSNMTIAGQTAPGDGICIRKGRLYFYGSNFIIRYLRFRIGDEYKTSLAALDIENAKDFIIDHCSLSWSVEENFTCYDNKRFTVQWCLLSEGLYSSYNPKGARSYGCQWGGQYASYHHNLFAHNVSRSPRINGCRAHDTTALQDFRNNVIYNWGNSNAIYGGEVEIADSENPGKARCTINWINNYYKPGPATPSTKYFAQPYYTSGYEYGKWYLAGNVMEGISGGMNMDNWLGINLNKVGSAINIRSDSMFTVEPVTTHSAEEAFALVLAHGGASYPQRDAVDSRIIGQITGAIPVFASGVFGMNKGIIDTQDSVGGWPTLQSLPAPTDSDHDGMPDEWELAHGLNPNDAADRNTISPAGYTMLEEYLNDLVGESTLVSVAETSLQPVKAQLYQNYPNPFNPVTTIEYELHTPAKIVLEAYDVLGRKIQTLYDGFQQAGRHSARFDATSLPSGMYIVQLKISSLTLSKTMVVLK